MSDDEKLNLDRVAAERAQAIINNTHFSVRGRPVTGGDVDNVVTKALGVLQENGVYACTLYLLSRTQDKEQKIADVVTDEMLNLLAGLGLQGWEKPTITDSRRKSEIVLKHITDNVTSDTLERLLLAKETLEQMLIYARYGAKARKAEEGD